MWIAIQNAVGARQGVGGGPGPGPGPGPPPYTPPLDGVTAAVAYSVRKLNSTYSGDCMLVRRVSDGATQPIGFGSNGLIDVNALATFSGGSELTVKVWYDQAGGAFDLEQPNDAYLPTIYDGAAVTTSTSGKPCVRIVRVSNAGPGEWLQTDPVSVSTAGNMDVFLVMAGNTNTGDRFIWDSNGGPTTSGQRFGILYPSQYKANGQGVTLNSGVADASTPVPNNLQFINNTRFYSNLEIYGNGVEFGSIVATNTSRTDPYNVALGARVGGNEGYNSFDISEIIHLPNYGVSNNESINLNINDYYQFTNLPYYSSGLLADYSGAAAAYSVRKLSNTAIKCMRVRRTVAPFDEQDIGFTPAGDLDTAAISTFGGSDPLVVSRWYDQSGFSRHAVQISPGAQPQIYNGTAVITENGKPTIDFASSYLVTSSYDSTPSGFMMFFSVYKSDTATYKILYSNNSGGSNRSFQSNIGRKAAVTSITGSTPASYDLVGSTDVFGSQNLVTHSIESGALKLYLNGTIDGTTSTTVNAASGVSTPVAIGAQPLGSDVADGNIQEIIHYTSTQSTTNQTAIELNIMTYYGIP